MKKSIILLILFSLISILVKGQQPIPITSLARSANPLMTVQTNASRYQSYQYFTTAWGDTLLNFMQANPNWLGTYLPDGAVNIAAAGNNLQFTQGGTFRWTGDTTSLGEWIPQFTVSPALSGGLINQRLIGVGSLANKYIGTSGQDNVGLYVDGYPDLYLRNSQIQDTALAAGVYEAEFDENGLLNYVEKDTCDIGSCWSLSGSVVSNNWQSVTYGNGLFVAVSNSGTGNRVMTSPDGRNWTIGASPADNGWRGGAYGNGLFVVVATSGTNRVMTSPDGINWTLRTEAAANAWQSVAYGNGLFVAIANSGTGNRVMTSPDGINWTSRTSAADNNWQSITYGNGLFVAVSLNGTGNRVMTSPDGINWTSRTPAADNNWVGVTYGSGLFVAVATSGTDRVMTSPDGINWTSRSAAVNNSWQSITYGNGAFVAVSTNGAGNRVMTSPDGINWTSRTSAADLTYSWIMYGNGVFVSVAVSSPTNVAYSGFPIVATPPINNIYQGNTKFTGQTITYSNYPSTRNDTENPDNLYFSRNANGDQGVKQLEDIFAIYNSQASSDLELVSTADSTTAYPLFSTVTKTNTDFYENQGDTVIFFKQPGVYRIDAGFIFETSGSTQSVNTILKFEPAVSYGRSFSIDANGDRISHAYNAVITVSTPYTKLRISKQVGAIATTTFFGSDSRITIQRVY